MKVTLCSRFLLSFFLLLCVGGISTLAQSNNAELDEKSGEPTLSETTSWLKDKILSSAWSIRRGEYFAHNEEYYTFDFVRFDQCKLTYKIRSKSIDTKDLATPNSEWTYEFSFSLSDIDPVSIRNSAVEDGSNRWHVELKTYEQKNVVQYKAEAIQLWSMLDRSYVKKKKSIPDITLTGRDGEKYYWKAEKKPVESKQMSISYIWSPDRETSKRMVKAFKHAVALCGGKVEPF